MMESRIVSMAPGGFGIARIDGVVHFVPETVPGDVVEIEAVTKKKGYTFSRLVRILSPSLARRTPFCPWYGECGGCDFQQITYEDQLRIKAEIFRDQMDRIGRFEDPVCPPITGSQAGRIRMRFQVREGRIGLFGRRTNRLCEMTECPVAHDPINEALQSIRKKLAEMPKRAGIKGEATCLTVGGKVHLHLDLPERAAAVLAESLGPPVAGSIIGKGAGRRSVGKPALSRKVAGVAVEISGDLFVQANPEINEIISGEIADFPAGSTKCFDLYCGWGNFTFPLARRCHEVVGIESSPFAVGAARKAALKGGLGNLSFFCRSAADADLASADGIVLDPPRPGLSRGLIEKILRAGPERIAYLSCNPATFARDLRHLVDGGYRIESIRLFDMFPQTHHIESLARLTRG